nr:protein FAM110C-like [Rhipicephalus microplus]
MWKAGELLRCGVLQWDRPGVAAVSDGFAAAALGTSPVTSGTLGPPLAGRVAAGACASWSVMAASVHPCCPTPLQPRERRLSAQAELGAGAHPRPPRPRSHAAAEQQTPGEQRRSAVERLEETKAQYVKSERVLDSRQGLRSRRSEGASFEPPLLARSPSAYELVERLRASPPAALACASTVAETPASSITTHARPCIVRDAGEDGYSGPPDSSKATPLVPAPRPSEPKLQSRGEVVPSSRRPVLRSKSDVAHRSQPDLGPVVRDVQRSLPDRFFDTLGLDASTWHSVLSPSTGSGSSRYFDSISSADSVGRSCSLAGSDTSSVGGGFGCAEGGAGLRNRDLVDHGPAETSIVEKNARVIKWLFNCRRAAISS